MSEDTRRIAVILFSDVVGFANADDPDQTTPVGLDDKTPTVLREIVAKHSGAWLHEIGDAALCAFESAAHALDCGLEVQQVFAAQSGFRPRIGIHVGDLVFGTTEIGSHAFGDGVNVAARVQALAEPGGICVTERIYEDLQNHRHALDFRYLGERELKDVNRPVKVYQIAGARGPIAIEDVTLPAGSAARPRWQISALAVMALAVTLALWLGRSTETGEPLAPDRADLASQVAVGATETDEPDLKIDPELAEKIARHEAFSDVRKRLLKLEGSGAFSAHVWTDPDPVKNDQKYGVWIEADCDCMALLFSIDGSSDHIALIHPNPFSIDPAVTTGESLLIPATDAFSLTAVGGEGIDVLKLIVLSGPIAFVEERTRSWNTAVFLTNEQQLSRIWSATPEQQEQVEQLRDLLSDLESAEWDEAATPLQIIP